ncbi:hypothetical protein REPUB_Repub11eG0000800 [Reevesia pubescens]
MEAVKLVIKVASLCGSLRKGYYNRGLLRSALEITKESDDGGNNDNAVAHTFLIRTKSEEERNKLATVDKAAAIVSTERGFGGGRSQYHLRQIGIFLDFHFINKLEFFLNAFQPPAKFDSDGNLIDPASKEKIKEVILSFQAFTLRLQGKC